MKDRRAVGVVFAALSVFWCALAVAGEPAALAGGLCELVHSWEGHSL
jgi:hypothetical protein